MTTKTSGEKPLYTTVAVRTTTLDRIDTIVKAGLYTSRGDFVKSAIRHEFERLQEHGGSL